MDKIHSFKLKDGLPVYIMPKPGFNKQFAILGIKYGSIDNQFRIKQNKGITKVPEGIAHFLEHKLFETPEGNIFEVFYKLGAQPNAFTTFTNTNYHFSSTDDFIDCLRILIDFVYNPHFTDEGIEKEIGIISKEIEMYQDDANWRLYFNLLRGLYERYPVRLDIAGTKESISEITKELLLQCHQTFYSPSNMILFLTGDVDMEKTRKELSKMEKDHKSRKIADIERIYPSEPTEVNKRETKEKMNVSAPMFALGYKEDVKASNETSVRRLLLTEIVLELLAGKSSDLYNEMYSMNLINLSFGTDYTGEKDFGYAVISGRTSDYKQAVEKIHKEIEIRQKKPWENEDFMRIKRKKIGEWLRGFNDLETIGNKFVSLYFKDIDFSEYDKELESINYNDILGHFKYMFGNARYSTSIIIPKK